jgi:hypothetical protein
MTSFIHLLGQAAEGDGSLTQADHGAGRECLPREGRIRTCSLALGLSLLKIFEAQSQLSDIGGQPGLRAGGPTVTSRQTFVSLLRDGLRRSLCTTS